MGRARGKGPFKGSGKGKDKGKGKGERVVKTQLSMQDRKVRLASLKKNSRCLRCGGYGHWAGDPECKMPNKKPNATASVPGQVPSQGKVGYFALSDSSGDDSGPLPCVVIGAGSNKKKCGYMGYRTLHGSPAKAKARSPLRPSPASSDGSFSQVSSHASGPRVPRMPAFRAKRVDPMGDMTLPPGSDHVFTFGQHKGYTYHEVLMQYPGYYVWGRNEPGTSRILSLLDWVDMYYDVDHGTHQVTPKLAPEEVQPRPAPVPGSRHKTATKKPPNPPVEISGHVCKDFCLLGSNAYVERKTCRDSGRVTRTPSNIYP